MFQRNTLKTSLSMRSRLGDWSVRVIWCGNRMQTIPQLPLNKQLTN